MTIERFTTEAGRKISGDEQLCLIWCEIHQKHEWHWIDRDDLPG